MYLVIAGYIPTVNSYAQFVDQFDIIDVSSTAKNTSEKPQSKVWMHDNIWWAVIPVDPDPPGVDGTYIWRLVGNTWTQELFLTSATKIKADTKVDGDTTHILLFRDGSSKLASVEYVPSSQTYKLWSTRETLVDIDLGVSGVETATIDIDSEGRMWLAYNILNTSTNDDDIKIMWSNSPFSNWSDPFVLKSSVDSDDLCAVTAFDGDKIGVLWSNQNDEQFQFKYHLDSDVPTVWSAEELASPNTTGEIADDHINLAVNGGTIYAAIKTSLSGGDNITIGLLERKNNIWTLYNVTKSGGTRPIVLFDETNSEIFVLYTTNSISADDIGYKTSSSSPISFSSLTILKAGSFNNVTSTKQNFNDKVVILYSTNDIWAGVVAGTSPLPVELVYFAGNLNGNKIELRWRTETEVNNYGFDIERSKDKSDWLTIGFAEGHGNSNSPKQYNFTDADIGLSGNYYFRLKQIDNDGTYEYSDVVSVEVGVPNNFYLSQNYPNPFNPETRIDFTLPEKQFVSLRIYNTLGELVRELVNEERETGSYSVTFDASGLPSGVYIYRIQTSSFAANKKMTFLK